MTTARRYLSRAEELQLAKFLEPLLKEESDGFVSYEEGWDDERVAAALANSRISWNHVQRYRVDVFGKLRPAKLLGVPTVLETRLKTLEEAQIKYQSRLNEAERSGRMLLDKIVILEKELTEIRLASRFKVVHR